MLNNICIMGRLTRDPEFKVTNTALALFTVACDRDKDHTDFIPCVAWRGTAEFVSKYFKKGSLIAVEGRLENNQFNDREGKKKDGWQVNVSKVNFCGGKASQGEDFTPVGVKFEELEGEDGELPF